MANVGTLFPGAKVRTTGNDAEDTKIIDKVLKRLNSESTSRTAITTAELGKLMGKKWRKSAHRILTPTFLSALDGIGWRYVSRRGRGGSRFERTTGQNEALAA